MTLRTRFRTLFSRDKQQKRQDDQRVQTRRRSDIPKNPSSCTVNDEQANASPQTADSQDHIAYLTAVAATAMINSPQHPLSTPHNSSGFDHEHNHVAQSVHGKGFFPGAQGFTIKESQFVDASSSTTNNVYGGHSGLEILRKNIAPNALHNARDRFDPPKCDEDTRTEVISEIVNWIQDRTTTSKILCITGAAGSGKSALEQTIAERCAKENVLAARFFFSSTDMSRNNELRLIPTIAYQIAQSNEDVRPFIARAVERDPNIFDQTLETQVEALLVRPLQTVKPTSEVQEPSRPYAILIDGLDECKGEEHQAHILRAIHTTIIGNNLPFRIVLASRPEYAIRTALSPTGHLHDIAYHIVLDNKYNPDDDIRRFLRRRLTTIGQKSNDPRVSIQSWPLESDVEILVDRSSGQFIYAATVVKFVSERRRSPVDLLNLIITWGPGVKHSQNPFSALDALYTNILISAQEAYQPFTEDDLAIVRLVHRLTCRAAFSTLALDEFLGLPAGESERMISDLFSLIYLDKDNNAQLHHKSFRDFLGDERRCRNFFIPETTIYSQLFLISMSTIQDATEDDISASEKAVRFGNDKEKLAMSLYFWLPFLGDSSLDGEEILDALDNLVDSGKWDFLQRVVELHETRDSEHMMSGTGRYWQMGVGDIVARSTKSGAVADPRWQRHLANFRNVATLLDETNNIRDL